jgi:hypothetical protein
LWNIPVFQFIFQFLLARHSEILPSSAEQAAVTALVNKVKQSLDKIVVAPETFPAVVCVQESYDLYTYKL